MSPFGLNRLPAIFFAHLTVVLMFALFLTIPARGTPSEYGKAPMLTVEWSLDAELVGSDSETRDMGSRNGKAGQIDTWPEKMRANGAKAEAHGVSIGQDHRVLYMLRASGKHDLEAFRNLIHVVAKPQFNLLRGVTEMEIEDSGTRGNDVVLVLDSNLSTGYVWHVSPESAMTESAPPEFEKHTTGYGVPERQTIWLTRRNVGSGPIKLVYKRAWEKDLVSATQLNLRLSTMPAKLDLTDPTASTAPFSAPQGVVHEKVFPKLESVLPAQFDWRKRGVVPAVRDQESCGSCWAFGTVGVMESVLLMNGAAESDLSEQFLVSCNKDRWNCDGGLTAHKYHFDTEGKRQTSVGAVLESAKPYTATNDSCSGNYDKPYILTGWEFITGSEWEVPADEQIKNAIYTYGPVTTGVCAGPGWSTAYPGGGAIYATDDTDYCSGSTNHQIVLVGWDDTEGYWILRNSWGAGWGLSGYMHIRYGISRVGEGPSWVTTGKYLTVTKTGSSAGTITSFPSGINCGKVCSYGFASGTVVTLTAIAASGSEFTGWSGACSGTGNTCTVTMDAGKSVSAAFASYALAVSKSGSGFGTVSSSPSGISCGTICSGQFAPGTVVTLTATASAGSVFTGWSGDGCSGITDTACALTMNSDKSANASFKPVCSYFAAPAMINFGYSGGHRNVVITAANTGRASCPKPEIALGPDSGWLTYDRFVFGTRNRGSLRLKTSTYTTSYKDRSPVQVTIMKPATAEGGPDGSLTVAQTGRPCTLSYTNSRHSSFDSSEHSDQAFTFTTTPSDCEWTVTVDPSCKDCSWMDIVSGSSGSGDGIVTYHVAAIPQGGRSRTGRFMTTLKQRPGLKRVFTVRQSSRP
jgi:C1A family cysteine protease